ncbi:hypothetical protein VTH06DRAFT_736 [Thermothelomyces fergusii]
MRNKTAYMIDFAVFATAKKQLSSQNWAGSSNKGFCCIEPQSGTIGGIKIPDARFAGVHSPSALFGGWRELLNRFRKQEV